MEIATIIAEYNPFHLGHKWQIDSIRQTLGQDTAIIAIMSGNVCQRGILAMQPKISRAGIACQNGVNLVLELPAIFAQAAAGYFAEGAIKLLLHTGIKTTLCFGAEYPHLQVLTAIAEIINNESTLFQQVIKDKLDLGLPYAKARASAITACFPSQSAENSDLKNGELINEKHEISEDLLNNILSSSNNILAIEYIAAKLKYDKDNKINLLPLARQGRDDNDLDFDELMPAAKQQTPGLFVSGSAIRHIIENGPLSPAYLIKKLAGQMPDMALAQLIFDLQNQQILTQAMVLPALKVKLRTMDVREMETLDGFSEGLADRINNLLRQNSQNNLNYDAFLELLANKRQPKTRIQRALLAALLGLKKTEALALRSSGPCYLRPLAFDKKGRYILKLLHKYGKAPIIGQASDFHKTTYQSPIYKHGELEILIGDVRNYLIHNTNVNEFDLIPYQG